MKHNLLLSAALSFTVLSASQLMAQNPFFALNAGGSSFTAGDGVVYVAENSASQLNPFDHAGGNVAQVSTAIENTSDDGIYQSERWGANSYTIYNLLNKEYYIVFKFAETYFNNAGARVFNVEAEGTTVISNLDIFAAAGGKNKAYDVGVKTTVADGALNIRFIQGSADQPKICGFAIYNEAPATVIPNSLSVLGKVTARDAFSVTKDFGTMPPENNWTTATSGQLKVGVSNYRGIFETTIANDRITCSSPRAGTTEIMGGWMKTNAGWGTTDISGGTVTASGIVTAADFKKTDGTSLLQKIAELEARILVLENK